MKFASWLPRFGIRTALTGLVAAGILHIITTMLAPSLTLQSGYDRLAKSAPEHAFVVLPEATPQQQAVPFSGPEARYAVCRFNTKTTQVLVEADLPGPGWVISIYSPQGDSILTTVGSPSDRSGCYCVSSKGSSIRPTRAHCCRRWCLPKIRRSSSLRSAVSWCCARPTRGRRTRRQISQF